MRPKLSELVQPLQAELVGLDVVLGRVHIDSRTLQQGDCFLALEGEHFDGHEFIDHAVALGASSLIVAKPTNTNIPTLIVDDTKKALTRLGALMRDNFAKPVVAVTGSCGKTTVKTLTAAILAQTCEVLATEGNKNNELGAPLMLCRLDDSYGAAVIELGANHPGEIARLTAITKPHAAMITNANPAHLEGFGSLEGVAKAKGEIFSGVQRPGFALLPHDSQFLDYWRSLCDGLTVLTFGMDAAADFAATKMQLGATGTKFTLVQQGQEVADIELPLLGQHNLSNALAACALASTTGATPAMMQQGLALAQAVSGRMVCLQGLHNSILLDDTYNANPTAVQAAMEFLSSHPQPQKWLVLGDMGELGADAQEWHSKIGSKAKQLGIDRLWTVGELTKATAEAFGDGSWHASSKESLVEKLKQELTADVVLLAKGSRSAAMETVINALGQV